MSIASVHHLPLSSAELKNISSEAIIDMSTNNFPPCVDHIRASMLFIRNSGIKLHYDFMSCPISERIKYLKQYITGDITVLIPELVDTWIAILLTRAYGNDTIDSIDDKLTIIPPSNMPSFIVDNQGLVNSVLRFIISLPACAIKYFSENSNNTAIENDLDIVEHVNINIGNIVNMIDHPLFSNIMTCNSGLTPVVYQDLFDPNGNAYLEKVLNGLPYLGLINIMMYGSNEMQTEFVDSVNDTIQNQKGDA